MYDPNYIEWGSQQGWRCPGCGRYYSPSTPMCFYCGGNQRTWTSPTTTGMPPNWDDYLKQTTTGNPSWWKDYVNISTADSAAAAGIQQEVKTGTGQATTTTDKNVVITAHNNKDDSETTCEITCDKCDKYQKTCFHGIENVVLSTNVKSIISHRKPLDIHLS